MNAETPRSASFGRLTALMKGAKLSILFAFFIIGLLSYFNILNTYFLSDDFAQIGKVVAGDWSVTWGESHGGFFRPLFVFTYVVDAYLWNRNPLGFHLTNLILHIFNSFLVMLLCAELTQGLKVPSSLRKRISIAAGFIFLLHPSHTEAVSWISGRADLLATFFVLLTLLTYVIYTRTKAYFYLILSLIAFIFALLSKESAVCLPLVIFSLALFIKMKDGFRAAFSESIKSTLLFACILTFYLFTRSYLLGTFIGGYGASQHLNFTHSVVISQLLRFFIRTLFPACALRSIPFLESRLLSPILIFFGCLVAVTTIILLARKRTRGVINKQLRRNSFVLWLTILFSCCLLPAINLRIDVYSTQGERFLYLPSIFFSIALSYVLMKLAPNAKLWLVIISSVLILYAASLWKTNEEWRSAAQLSQSIVNDLARQATQETILILNAPDDVQGIHLYRNGLEEALRSFQDVRKIRNVHVLSYHSIQSPAEEIELSEESGTLKLQLTYYKSAFTKFNEFASCVEFIEQAKSFCQFRIGECPPTTEIFYFNQGRIFAVNKSFSARHKLD